MSISDRIDPCTFRRKMEITQSFKEGMDEEVFISHRSRNNSFVIIIVKVVFPTLNLDLAGKQLCFPPSERYK